MIATMPPPSRDSRFAPASVSVSVRGAAALSSAPANPTASTTDSTRVASPDQSRSCAVIGGHALMHVDREAFGVAAQQTVDIARRGQQLVAHLIQHRPKLAQG